MTTARMYTNGGLAVGANITARISSSSMEAADQKLAELGFERTCEWAVTGAGWVTEVRKKKMEYSEEEIRKAAGELGWGLTPTGKLLDLLAGNRDGGTLTIGKTDYPSNLTVHLANEHSLTPEDILADEKEMTHALAHLRGQFRAGRGHYH